MNKLVRLDPFTEPNALQKQFFGEDLISPLKNVSIPTTDVYTNDDKELIVEAHLPNFNEEDVSIYVEENALTLQAERHEKEEDKSKKYVVRESSSSFYRRIQLPERADTEQINAQLDDGVLKVSIPLTSLPKPRKISIQKNHSANK